MKNQRGSNKILILIIIAIIIAIGFFIIKSREKSPENTADIQQQHTVLSAPTDRKTVLGTATRSFLGGTFTLAIEAKLAKLSGSQYYEVWVATPDKTTAMGKLNYDQTSDKYTFGVKTPDSKMNYPIIIISKESTVMPKMQTRIIDGSF